MNIERRFVPTTAADSTVTLEERGEGDAKEKMIVGRAVVYYDNTPATEYVMYEGKTERVVERIMPGACNRALAEKQDVRCLFNHRSELILGRTVAGTLDLSVDERGLKYSCKPGKTTVANDVREHLSRGDVTGSSFGFVSRKSTWTRTVEQLADKTERTTYLRTVEDMDMMDVSPVTYPAYKSTEAGMRSGETDQREVDRLLGEARAATPTAPAAPPAPEQKPDAGDGDQALRAKLTAYQLRARLVELSEGAD